MKLQKKELKLEYWPRLLKENKRLHFLKTDFDKWVDEDEQNEAPEEDFSQFGGMGGMPGMGGGMGGTLHTNPVSQSLLTVNTLLTLFLFALQVTLAASTSPSSAALPACPTWVARRTSTAATTTRTMSRRFPLPRPNLLVPSVC